MPAAQRGRWSQSDGFGDLTLQFDLCGQAGKGTCSPSAAPEEQAEQNVMWDAVIFWSALFWHLLSCDSGELLDGKGWLQGMTVPGFRLIVFGFREAENASAFTYLPPDNYTSRGDGLAGRESRALGNLAPARSGIRIPGMPLIRSLMKQAAEKVESPSPGDIKGHMGQSVPSQSRPFPFYKTPLIKG